MRPPLYGPVRYPPPKKPKLLEKEDAAIDDPRLQALCETGDRELRELRELAKLRPLKRKPTDDEQLSKEDAATDDANQGPVGEHRLRELERRRPPRASPAPRTPSARARHVPRRAARVGRLHATVSID